MRNILFNLLIVFVVVGSSVLLGACEDDKYYERPEWLEKPVYSYLEEQGNFNSYLACVDKSGYATNLKSSGYYTVFAPNDEAFNTFFKDKGFNSINDIDKELANKIVAYSLVQVASLEEAIDDVQATVEPEDEELILDNAFKRASYYYKGVYEYTGLDGNTRFIVDANSFIGSSEQSYGINVNNFNMKSIPYFTNAFLAKNKLTELDYKFFFPDADFTGFNVVDAKVLNKDIVTENGVIHEVDKVILPLPNLEEIFIDAEEGKDFLEIIEKYMVRYFRTPREFELRQQQATGSQKEIYVKDYHGLRFPLAAEDFTLGLGTARQNDGFSLFVPTNEALNNFMQNVFLAKGYNNLDEVPSFVLDEFINAHLFNHTVWPSKFSTAQNTHGEPARFNVETDVVSSSMGSNGLFYLVDKVQETNAFYTVLGEILLNPKYTTLYQALVDTENNFILRNPILNLNVFLMPNEHFEQINLSYNIGLNQWEHDNPDWALMDAFTILNRLVHLHIILNKDIDITEGFGLIETNNGEYIRYVAAAGGIRVWASGQTIATAARIVMKENGEYADITNNGNTMDLDRPLLFSTRNVGQFLDGNQNYRAFFRYLEKSANSLVEGAEAPDEFSRMVYDPDTKEIIGVSSTYNQTYLIPNANAIEQAIADGLLPEIGQADFSNDDQEKVLRFVRYHILNDRIVYTNNDYNLERCFTHLRDEDGETFVYVDGNGSDKLEFTDIRGRFATATATATSTHTNVLANRAVIHLIDNYLDYRPFEEDESEQD